MTKDIEFLTDQLHETSRKNCFHGHAEWSADDWWSI